MLDLHTSTWVEDGKVKTYFDLMCNVDWELYSRLLNLA